MDARAQAHSAQLSSAELGSGPLHLNHEQVRALVARGERKGRGGGRGGVVGGRGDLGGVAHGEGGAVDVQGACGEVSTCAMCVCMHVCACVCARTCERTQARLRTHA